MLCVITHIREDFFKNSNINHTNQVNTVIKTLFATLSEKEFHETFDNFWSECKHFNNKNDLFDSN